MRKYLSVIFLFLICGSAFATHQRAGEITYVWKGGLTYEVTILTYTYAPSPADRPSLEISWGDGTYSELPRIEKIDLPNEIRRNVYIGEHTYNGNGSYWISVEDPNRNYGILNIPNSVNVPFFIQSLLVINPFFTPNNSPQLLLPPIDNGCTNIPYIHNPGAWDVDGDSLSYRLVVCRGANGMPILGYALPNQVAGNAGSSITLDPLSGEFIWDSPKSQGEYNIAILIEEWRYGILIGSVVRDMQIIIQACNNHPPQLTDLPDTCVIAGQSVEFTVTATDPDNHLITLTGTGGPMQVNISPAVFRDTAAYGTVSQDFFWQTVCDHVQAAPYPMYFKAVDNGYPVNLADIIKVNISVIAPAVPGLTVTPSGNNMLLAWLPSPCPNAIGYRIYRRSGFYGYEPGYCETGVPSYTGYVAIKNIDGLNNLTFTDDNNGTGLVHGVEYCYIVTARFTDGAESIAGDEVCATLKRDLPIITNVSIVATDPANGRVRVAWVKPTELDTIQVPGPYKYFIYRSPANNQPFDLVDSLDGLDATEYFDQPLNTRNNRITYKIGLLNNTPGNRFMAGNSQPASSVFLYLFPSDQSILLKWSASVPWTNDTFIVFRQNPLTLSFDSIGYSTQTNFTDTGLVNGRDYCYLVKSLGAYSSASLPKPLINWSQVNCASPADNVPPCPPELVLTVNCEPAIVTLNWTFPDPGCSGDVYMFYIYFAPEAGDSLEMIDSLPALSNTYSRTDLVSIAGCYGIRAVDSSGNISWLSNIACSDIDACPPYRLPNVFTPDGDDKNPVFRPFPYTSVEKVDMTIYNRWGIKVYMTEDPDILWDGKDMHSGQLCSEGVYYYVCDVYERRLEGIRKRTLTGIVYLID